MCKQMGEKQSKDATRLVRSLAEDASSDIRFLAGWKSCGASLHGAWRRHVDDMETRATSYQVTYAACPATLPLLTPHVRVTPLGMQCHMQRMISASTASMQNFKSETDKKPDGPESILCILFSCRIFSHIFCSLFFYLFFFTTFLFFLLVIFLHLFSLVFF